MFVCICNAITERQIREYAAAGVTTLEELRMRSGCSDCCGQCSDEAEAILGAAVSHSQLPKISIPVFQVA